MDDPIEALVSFIDDVIDTVEDQTNQFAQLAGGLRESCNYLKQAVARDFSENIAAVDSSRSLTKRARGRPPKNKAKVHSSGTSVKHTRGRPPKDKVKRLSSPGSKTEHK